MNYWENGLLIPEKTQLLYKMNLRKNCLNGWGLNKNTGAKEVCCGVFSHIKRLIDFVYAIKPFSTPSSCIDNRSSPWWCIPNLFFQASQWYTHCLCIWIHPPCCWLSSSFLWSFPESWGFAGCVQSRIIWPWWFVPWVKTLGRFPSVCFLGWPKSNFYFHNITENSAACMILVKSWPQRLHNFSKGFMAVLSSAGLCIFLDCFFAYCWRLSLKGRSYPSLWYLPCQITMTVWQLIVKWIKRTNEDEMSE